VVRSVSHADQLVGGDLDADEAGALGPYAISVAADRSPAPPPSAHFGDPAVGQQGSGHLGHRRPVTVRCAAGLGAGERAVSEEGLKTRAAAAAGRRASYADHTFPPEK